MTGSDLHGRTVAALDRIPSEVGVIVWGGSPARVLATRDGAGDFAVVVALDSEEADRG